MRDWYRSLGVENFFDTSSQGYTELEDYQDLTEPVLDEEGIVTGVKWVGERNITTLFANLRRMGPVHQQRVKTIMEKLQDKDEFTRQQYALQWAIGGRRCEDRDLDVLSQTERDLLLECGDGDRSMHLTDIRMSVSKLLQRKRIKLLQPFITDNGENSEQSLYMRVLLREPLDLCSYDMKMQFPHCASGMLPLEGFLETVYQAWTPEALISEAVEYYSDTGAQEILDWAKAQEEYKSNARGMIFETSDEDTLPRLKRDVAEHALISVGAISTSPLYDNPKWLHEVG